MSDSLRDDLLRPPAEAWRPNAADVLIGEVVELEERHGFAERPYIVVTLKDEATGEYRAFHAFHTVAADELVKAAPKIGDRMGIAFHGMVEKGETRYASYRVKVQRSGDLDLSDRPELDWQAIRPAAAHEREQLDEPRDASPGEGEEDIPF